MEHIKITIVTVTYNCVNDIEATIQSVLSQDYPNLEYIIVDGASTDGTVDIIRQYDGEISRWISEPDNGLYDAMNKGIRMATGQWINFMNAGDSFCDNQVISNLFDSLPHGKKVVYGNTQILNRDGSISFHPTSTIERLKWTINRYQPYTHQAVFYNIECKEDCKYNLNYSIVADYDVACKYWNRYGIKRYHYAPITICMYKGFDGVSSNVSNAKRARKEKILVKIRNKMNILQIIKDSLTFFFI